MKEGGGEQDAEWGPGRRGGEGMMCVGDRGEHIRKGKKRGENDERDEEGEGR